MLDRLPDHYRIVDSKPSDAIIGQRREAIAELAGTLSDKATLLPAIDVAAFGVGDLGGGNKELVELVTKAIQARQPSYPADMEQNRMDLQVTTAIALGEFLRAAVDKPSETATMAAGVLVAAIGTREPPTERHLAKLMSELLEHSTKLLDAEAQLKRRRDVALDKLETFAPLADVPQAFKTLVQTLTGICEELVASASADREEVEILWWMFGRHSNLVDQPLARLDGGAKTLVVGVELANMVVLPPLGNASHLVRTAMGDSDKKVALSSLVASWTEAVLPLLSSKLSAPQEAVKAHPRLLPLSWLCTRLIASDRAQGWEDEFGKKTNLRSEVKRPLSDWAVQVFNERVAQRLLED